MKLRQLASNMTELQINGTTVLFSYETPVAAHTSDGWIKTSKKWSITTSRHINKWLACNQAVTSAVKEVSQESLDALVK